MTGKLEPVKEDLQDFLELRPDHQFD